MNKLAQNTPKDDFVEAGQCWRFPVILSFSVLIGILALHYQTAWSIISIWLRSDTFAHGFLIFPISAWLIWDRRQHLVHLTPKPEYRALVVLFGTGFVWLLGNLVDVLIVQQLALVAMLICGIWGVLGNQVGLAILFPLLFLFFAVPMGEELVPSMMEFTADFTVALLRITGIPVYREGLFFSLPSGNWSVIEGCSGVRYLIASITLGCVFAYITYHSLAKRVAFIIAAIIVPIIANGLRAYGIVMLGHLSDMTIAVGVDHLLYGWVFFGLVMLILFSIGAIWRDSDEVIVNSSEEISASVISDSNVPVHYYKPALLTLLIVVVWPLFSFGLSQSQSMAQNIPLQAPASKNGWIIHNEAEWAWKPSILRADNESLRFYKKEGNIVSVYLGQYLNQKQGAELVSSQNRLIAAKDERWQQIKVNGVNASLNGLNVELKQGQLRGEGVQLLIWRWYRVGADYTASNYYAKLLEAKARLMSGRQDGAILIIATPFQASPSDAKIILQSFVNEMLPQIESVLDEAFSNAESS